MRGGDYRIVRMMSRAGWEYDLCCGRSVYLAFTFLRGIGSLGWLVGEVVSEQPKWTAIRHVKFARIELD